MSQKRYFDIHAPVFWPSTIIILIFIVVTLSVGEPMQEVFTNIQNSVSTNFKWVFIMSVNLFLAFVLYLAFSKYGHIRLGGSKATPEFNKLSWFAMLFSAGMGIGILFWSVAEPIFHFITPPVGEARTLEAARQAMGVSFLHWGLHAWGIYAFVGMALAFFAYNRGQPLTIRSIFSPLLRGRLKRPAGNVIDVLAVVATLFGLATSLGLGVKQVSAGLAHLFGIGNTVTTQVILITLITGAATISVVTGLGKGVRILSEWNVRMAVVFLVMMLVLGPSLFIFDSLFQNIGYYLQNFLRMSFWTESYTQTNWQNSWTVFYWAWWISWSPFVGMFIARISRGRTIREFVLGVLIVPSLITFLWLTAFGGSAIFLELNGTAGVIAAVQENVATALYIFLENFPLSTVTSGLAILLVTSFFVTSSDSGSLVIDSITTGGKLDAPVGQRIFWAVTEGLVAAVLLVGGGLAALQAAAISSGLPFAFLLVIGCYSLYKGIKAEYHEKHVLPSQKANRQANYQKAAETKKAGTGR